MPAVAPERRFLVERVLGTVTIREIEPGSSRFSFNREDAWVTAQRRARPAKRALFEPLRHQARIVFVALDGSRKEGGAGGVAVR